MPWLGHLAVLFAFLADFTRPASAFVLASPGLASEPASLPPTSFIGDLGAASLEQYQGIAAAYDEHASGYRFAARSGPALVRELGAAGEAAAGLPKNTTRTPSLTGMGSYRIPDVLNRETRLLGEVKNVGSLSYINQLPDFVGYAKQQGIRFELAVRQGTQLSGPLQHAVSAGDIIL